MVNNAFEENDNHQSADNNVDGQNVDMADEGEHVMIMTTETVYLIQTIERQWHFTE